MKVNRVVQIDTSSFQIGDQISVGCYTATCQRVMAWMPLPDPYKIFTESGENVTEN